MRPNQQQMNQLIKTKAAETETPIQSISRLYGLEQLIKKLAGSPYQEHLVLKGGYLLTTRYGLENRSTQDLDATLRNIDWTQEEAEKLVAFLQEPNEDGEIVFKDSRIRESREDSNLQGFNIKLNFVNGKSRYPLDLDLTAGEVLLPIESNSEVPLMFEEGTIVLNTYSVEQILSDKIYATLAFGNVSDDNSRAKDLYDIYFLLSQNKEINYSLISSAVTETITQRHQNIKPKDYLNIIKYLSQSEHQKYFWEAYRNDHSFAQSISFTTIMKSVENLAKSLVLEEVKKLQNQPQNKFEERLTKAKNAQSHLKRSNPMPDESKHKGRSL